MGLPLMAPSPGINYNFVVGAYLVCTSLLGVLLALDKYFAVEAVKGAWIVFTPFLPCSLWAIVVRSQWLSERDGSGSEKPKEE